MRWFRSILAGFCFSVFGLGSLLFGFFLVIFLPLFPKNKRRYISVSVNRQLWRVFVGLMVGTGLIGVRGRQLKKLQHERGSLIVANHPSLIDVVLLVAQTPKPVCIVKSSLGRNFLLRRIVHTAHLVNDLPPDILLREVSELLEAGYNILIFPEGTRSGASSVFHRGAARLALETGAFLRPIRIRVSPPILGKNQPWWDVSDHRVLYTFEVKGRINPTFFKNSQQSSAQNARHLTAALKSQILE